MNIKLSFLGGMILASIVILAGAITISACEDVRIGKTRKELAREMFEVDSLMRTIQLQLDSTSIDFEKFYINAQRINNGTK
tara:strand:- start:82 stop:324 length:243 start_codon:yes stop_codon:yes gene_type:complete